MAMGKDYLRDVIMGYNMITRGSKIIQHEWYGSRNWLPYEVWISKVLLHLNGWTNHFDSFVSICSLGQVDETNKNILKKSEPTAVQLQ